MDFEKSSLALNVRKNCSIGVATLLIVASSLMAGCASGPPSYELNVRTALSGPGTISVKRLDENTVVVSGWTDSNYSKGLVMSAARRGEGITKVIDRVFVYD